MSRKPKDLTGMRSGKLIVESMVFQNGRTKCRCRCDCGNVTVINCFPFVHKKCISCGCSRSRKGSESVRWTGCGEISGTYWNVIKENASRRGRKLSIKIEYAWSVYQKQKGICCLSGIPLSFAVSNKEFKEGKATASLDRIDSSKGYIEGNVQWVHKDINKLKTDFEQDYFVELCKKVSGFNENSNSS